MSRNIKSVTSSKSQADGYRSSWQLARRVDFVKICLAGCAITTSFQTVGYCEEVKTEVRARTDANRAADIQAAREWQRSLLDSQGPKGLSELSKELPKYEPLASASAVASSSNLHEQSSVIIGSECTPCGPIVIGEQPVPDANFSIGNSQADSNVSRVIQSSYDEESTKAPRLAPQLSESTNKVISSIRLLPSPTISRIDSFESDRRQAPSLIAPSTSSRNWRPVSAQIGSNDAEATIRPQIGSSDGPIQISPRSTIVDSSVVPANFQGPTGGFAQPNFNPPAGQPVLPGPSNGVILPAPPVTQVVPGSIPPSYFPQGQSIPGQTLPSQPGLYSGNVAPTLPYNNGSIPNYPLRGSTIISGEPFVTGPPCQYDAYDMVEPAACYAPVDACGPPSQTYSGIPGSVAPPTLYANQAPGLYPSGGAGYRPLIGFGQDPYNVQLGRGIIGQPVAYVPGQPLRNFMRYIFP